MIRIISYLYIRFIKLTFFYIVLNQLFHLILRGTGESSDFLSNMSLLVSMVFFLLYSLILFIIIKTIVSYEDV